MASIHQVLSAKDGDEFISVGPAFVKNQSATRVSKNNRHFATVTLKSASGEVLLMLWDAAALWKFPTDAELTFRGRFVRSTYGGKAQINCDELTPPEGAATIQPPANGPTMAQDAPEQVVRPCIKECVDHALRAAEYVTKKGHPALAEAAFVFAMNARFQGAKAEP